MIDFYSISFSSVLIAATSAVCNYFVQYSIRGIETVFVEEMRTNNITTVG